MNTLKSLTFVSLLAVTACGPRITVNLPPTTSTQVTPVAPLCGLALGEVTPWNHSVRAGFATEMGGAHHSSQGSIAIANEAYVVEGKFAYGAVSKDLEGEHIRAFLRTGECSYEEVGFGTTDSDGRVSIEMEPRDPGTYEYVLVVAGDHTIARSTATLLARGAQIAVFDIDGTLTTDDGEVFEEVLLNGTPEMHDGAVGVVEHYVANGVQPIYVTGRTYHLTGKTLAWLEGRGFPAGSLHTTDSIGDALPGDEVEAYKLAFLESLKALDLEIVAAYGNASSDVCAYARAGVASDATFIIGENAGTACEGFDASQPVMSYPTHLEGLTR